LALSAAAKLKRTAEISLANSTWNETYIFKENAAY
jgi:hypothetical protein